MNSGLNLTRPALLIAVVCNYISLAGCNQSSLTAKIRTGNASQSSAIELSENPVTVFMGVPKELKPILKIRGTDSSDVEKIIWSGSSDGIFEIMTDQASGSTLLKGMRVGSTKLTGTYGTIKQVFDVNVIDSATTTTTVTPTDVAAKDLTPPSMTFASIDPPSPHWTLTPTITISLTKNATVTLYSDSSCTASISPATSLTAGSGKTITAGSVPSIKRSTVYGKAVDTAGSASDCVSLTSFTHILRLEDPNRSPGNGFGTAMVELSNGNIVVTSPEADIGGVTDAGAVYLFNGTTGALISSLYGSTLNDKVGGDGVLALSNGNFIVRSTDWDCQASLDCAGTIANVGAVTWGSATIGVNGPVTASNSLVGSTANDDIGMLAIALTNGNYVVASEKWDCKLTLGCPGTVVDAGAVTWGSGATGVSGAVTSTNSLIGTTASDLVGRTINALTNGNYVITSDFWDCQVALGCAGFAENAGAATWASGLTGITGTISPTNSLIGSSAFDYVGKSVLTLTNGNYVVGSPTWNCQIAQGCTNTDTLVGAATWGNGATGIVGLVSASNSLVGSTHFDHVGFYLTGLSNGNYLVRSVLWSCRVAKGCASSADSAGAVTWGSGTTGTTGAVTASNSLVGSTLHDLVGGAVTALTNGNYVVGSPAWDCKATLGCAGTITDAGAATWGSGASGVSGFVSASNSLVGSTASDSVGTDVTALTNGNYVVGTPSWDCQASRGCAGTVANVGAATWGDGATGITGAVSASNSLVASTLDDGANLAVTPLTNGNYVVVRSAWDCLASQGCSGTIAGVGAVTWASGATGISGLVSTSNSLVGSTASDTVGSEGVTALSNGNYVVNSPQWDTLTALGTGGAGTNVGAATWGSGSTGVSGAVSESNSSFGTTDGDQLSLSPAIALTNGNYILRSILWTCQLTLGCSGYQAYIGAAAWASGTTGRNGPITALTSSVGSNTGQAFGNMTWTLANGNFLVFTTFTGGAASALPDPAGATVFPGDVSVNGQF